MQFREAPFLQREEGEEGGWLLGGEGVLLAVYGGVRRCRVFGWKRSMDSVVVAAAVREDPLSSCEWGRQGGGKAG